MTHGVNVGDVIWLFAGTIDNPKQKMKLCVCIDPEGGWFFRINSRSHWPESIPISSTVETFLEHDSFIECGSPVEYLESEIDDAVRVPKNHLGSLTRVALQEVAEQVRQSRMLPKMTRI